jgi:hypothetical protein
MAAITRMAATCAWSFQSPFSPSIGKNHVVHILEIHIAITFVLLAVVVIIVGIVVSIL